MESISVPDKTVKLFFVVVFFHCNHHERVKCEIHSVQNRETLIILIYLLYLQAEGDKHHVNDEAVSTRVILCLNTAAGNIEEKENSQQSYVLNIWTTLRSSKQQQTQCFIQFPPVVLSLNTLLNWHCDVDIAAWCVALIYTHTHAQCAIYKTVFILFRRPSSTKLEHILIYPASHNMLFYCSFKNWELLQHSNL